VRGEFVPAMRDYLACSRTYHGGGLPSDLTAYLGERVLTTEELQGVVKTLPPDRLSPTSPNMDFQDAQLRTVLTKRLVREGRYQDALAYADAVTNVTSYNYYDESFDTGLSKNLKTQRDLIQAYAVAQDQTQNAGSDVAKATAWYQLALLTRVEHQQILDHESKLYKDRATPSLPGVSPAELARLKENYTRPDQDNLRWYIAYDDALKAAQLVPQRSQAYAAILCHAGHWMNEAPPEAIDGHDPIANLRQAWQLYLKHGAYVRWAGGFGHRCPDPDFAAAARPAWWRRFTRLVARLHIHPLTLIAAGSAFVLLILTLFGLLIIKKRRGARSPA
jgi:cellulose synthase operon protein C